MATYVRTIRWRLYTPEGGGFVYVFDVDPEHTSETQRKILFNSLDDPQLPRDIAEAIRKDGRKEGEAEIA